MEQIPRAEPGGENPLDVSAVPSSDGVPGVSPHAAATSARSPPAVSAPSRTGGSQLASTPKYSHHRGDHLRSVRVLNSPVKLALAGSKARSP